MCSYWWSLKWHISLIACSMSDIQRQRGGKGKRGEEKEEEEEEDEYLIICVSGSRGVIGREGKRGEKRIASWLLCRIIYYSTNDDWNTYECGRIGRRNWKFVQYWQHHLHPDCYKGQQCPCQIMLSRFLESYGEQKTHLRMTLYFLREPYGVPIAATDQVTSKK